MWVTAATGPIPPSNSSYRILGTIRPTPDLVSSSASVLPPVLGIIPSSSGVVPHF